MRYFCERTEQKRSAMKNISRNILVYTAATVLVVGALPGARAQTVDTRIGSLSFERGLPTEDTVTKLFDTLDFQRACQAYVWALPIVGIGTFQRAHYQTFGASDCDIVTYQTYRDKLGILTPNATTPYIVSFVNLERTGPVVIDLPAGANASGVCDFWQHAITDMGQVGPDKGAGGKYLIIGPGQTVPPDAEDYIVVRSTTNNIWPGFRALDPDPAKTQQWIDKVRIYPYAQREHPRKQKFLTPERLGFRRSPVGLRIGNCSRTLLTRNRCRSVTEL